MNLFERSYLGVYGANSSLDEDVPFPKWTGGYKHLTQGRTVVLNRLVLSAEAWCTSCLNWQAARSVLKVNSAKGDSGWRKTKPRSKCVPGKATTLSSLWPRHRLRRSIHSISWESPSCYYVTVFVPPCVQVSLDLSFTHTAHSVSASV